MTDFTVNRELIRKTVREHVAKMDFELESSVETVREYVKNHLDRYRLRCQEVIEAVYQTLKDDLTKNKVEFNEDEYLLAVSEITGDEVWQGVKDHFKNTVPCVYFITVFENIPFDEEDPLKAHIAMRSSRTVGYRYTLEQAVEALNENMCDLRETVYNGAIVEKMGPYLYPDPEQTIYFAWDDKRKGYFEIRKPACFAHLCNIAIG